MNDLFADLFNKVLGFFHKVEKEENSQEIACNRLRVVLMQDRTNLTPELLERMRGELVELLSKYLEMDKEALELNLEQDGDQVALALSIPVIRAKSEEEIQEAIKAQEEAIKAEKEDSESEEKEEETDKSEGAEDKKEEEIQAEDENVEEDEAAEEEPDEDESPQKAEETSDAKTDSKSNKKEEKN